MVRPSWRWNTDFFFSVQQMCPCGEKKLLFAGCFIQKKNKKKHCLEGQLRLNPDTHIVYCILRYPLNLSPVHPSQASPAAQFCRRQPDSNSKQLSGAGS